MGGIISIRKFTFVLLAIGVMILGSIFAWGYSQPWAVQEKPLKGIPILMYHKVNPDFDKGGLGLRINPADFDWEMKYLKDNGYHSVDLGAVVDHFKEGKRLPDKPIVITFDDGYQDNYRYAYPILKKYGFTATIFIVTNTVGGINEFDYRSNIQPMNKMLTWKEIKEMDANGITIGAHTLDHPHLTKISLAEAKRQISGSKKILEKKLGKEIEYFSYPYGEYDRAVAEIVKESGFRAAASSDPGVVRSATSRYTLNRISTSGRLNHRRFIEELNKY